VLSDRDQTDTRCKQQIRSLYTDHIRSLRTIIDQPHTTSPSWSPTHPRCVTFSGTGPETQEGFRTVPLINSKLQKSNIVAVSVSPGIGRVDTVSHILNADWTGTEGKNKLVRSISVNYSPLLNLFVKRTMITDLSS
jgi:hypothetical protein